MKTRPYLIHALSATHAGTGQSVDIIDLPIARMSSTNIPMIPGSSIKGVMRDDQRDSAQAKEASQAWTVYGPDTDNGDLFAGALMVNDARLLALPVRSFKGTFAWVTSPLLLQLALRDLVGAKNAPQKVPSVAGTGRCASVLSIKSSVNVHSKNNKNTLYLEDLDLEVTEVPALKEWSDFLASFVAWKGQEQMFASRFVLLDDETMNFLAETSTQIDTRIRLNPETRTTIKGALWTEESLPPETLLIGLLAAYKGKNKGKPMNAQEVLDFALPEEKILQFGGKASIGRGRCRLIPLTQKAKGGVV